MQNEIKIDKNLPSDFTNFRISKSTQETLKSKKINSLFPIQSATFDYLFEGNDLIGRDRTGSGKTLAFSLPILERFRKNNQFKDHSHIKMLIMVPTRELTNQTFNTMNSLKNTNEEFQSLSIYGGTSIEKQINSLKRGVDILIATPGRLIDLMDRNEVDFSNLEVVVFDETDEMLKIGFQKDIEYIIDLIQKDLNEKQLQFLMFSATVPAWVKGIARRYMKKNHYYVNMIQENLNQTSETVEHFKVSAFNFHQKFELISNFVSVHVGKKGRCIIFTNTKSNFF